MKDPRKEARFKQMPFEKQNRMLLEAILENQMEREKLEESPPRTLTLRREKSA